MPYSAAPSFGVLASCCSLVLMLAAARSAAAAPPHDDGAPDGAALFDRHCAVCHDSDGRARSAIAERLLPRPRDFGEGIFQLSSAENGVPIAVTAAESIERLRTWASGRCLSASEPGLYRFDKKGTKTRRRVSRDPSTN